MWHTLPQDQRDWWIARHEIEQERHSCGYPRSVCSDPERTWWPHRTTCHVSMETEAAIDKYQRLHADLPWHDGTFKNWVAKPDDDHPYRYDMGVTVRVADRDVNPDDHFLSNDSNDGEDGDG